MSRPNLLFLFPDQLRADFVGAYGARFLKTPAIDRLASQGTLYETVVSPCPICVPARASLLTGQHAFANGVIDNLAWLRPDRKKMGIETWPELFADNGYTTAAIGKMHFYPWDLLEGFQKRIIAEDKRHIHVEDDYFEFLRTKGCHKEHGNEQRGYQEHKGASLNDLPEDIQVDRWVANQAIEFLENYREDKPYALMVGFPGPHCPYDPPEDELKRIDPEKLPAPRKATRESLSHRDGFVTSYKRSWADLDYSSLTIEEIVRIRQHYSVLVERMDEDIDRIIAALEKSGKLDNTIVVFASDHGDYLGDFELMGKTFFHEPSIRVPLIVADFRNPEKKREKEMRNLIDLFPSLLKWAGIDNCSQAQGIPLDEQDEERVVVGMTTHGVMARSQKHKLVRYNNGAEALYDLENDPEEQHNIINSAESVSLRHSLEIELVRQLVGGTISGHWDKKVLDAQAEAPHAFYRRGWVRPYPAKFQ